MQKDDKITVALPDGSVRTGTIRWENDVSQESITRVKRHIGNKFTDPHRRAWAQGYIAALYDISIPSELTPLNIKEWDYLNNYINGDAE